MNGAYPWQEVMKMALGALQIPAGEFWQMTPAELCAAWQGRLEWLGYGQPVLEAQQVRQFLQDMAKRFPDSA